MSSPEVEDEARCRIPGDGEDVRPTSVEELPWRLDRPDLWLQDKGGGEGELQRMRDGARIWQSGGRGRRIRAAECAGKGMMERFYFIVTYLGCGLDDDDEAAEHGNRDGDGGASQAAESTKGKRHEGTLKKLHKLKLL